MATVQLFRREAVNFARFDDIDREHRDANIDSIFYYAVFYPAIEAVSALASALIIWYGGASVIGGTAHRSARSPRSCSTRSASSGRSATCRRSSTCCSRRWPRRSGSSSCSTSRCTIESPAQPVAPPCRRRRRTDRLRARVVRLQRGDRWRRARLGPEGRVVRGRARRAHRHRRRDRIGEDDADQPAAAVLRRAARTHHDRRRGRPRARPGDLRGLFSLVLQDVHLFSGTIADNIRLGNRRSTDEQVQARGAGGACRRVHRAAAARL